MVTGGNQPPPGLGGAGGAAAAGGGGGTALATTAPLGQNVVQQRNKKKQVRGSLCSFVFFGTDDPLWETIAPHHPCCHHATRKSRSSFAATYRRMHG